MRGRAWFRWAFTVAATIAAACTQATNTDSPISVNQGPSPDASADASASTAPKPGTVVSLKEIGPQGGVLTTPDHYVTMVIPAGALSTTKYLGIREIDSAAVVLPQGAELASQAAYAFEPADLTFALPVSVTIYAHNDRPPSVESGIPKPFVLLRSPSGANQWTTITVASPTWDSVLTGETDRLGDWAIASAEAPYTCAMACLPGGSPDPSLGDASPTTGLGCGTVQDWDRRIHCVYDFGKTEMFCSCRGVIGPAIPQTIAPTCERIAEVQAQTCLPSVAPPDDSDAAPSDSGFSDADADSD